uniref:Uncharacterized protein n=1 Tax=Odontella aurita TaxID=265563 RepID=A0A7S4I5U9_9STRA|mmetsp:Transcript_20402/g.59052  ORF Transcript_20402/g.59052 Transcript_20402/m.59052 type:complete len:122 (+) Transcript_20402:553-918(+)
MLLSIIYESDRDNSCIFIDGGEGGNELTYAVHQISTQDICSRDNHLISLKINILGSEHPIDQSRIQCSNNTHEHIIGRGLTMRERETLQRSHRSGSPPTQTPETCNSAFKTDFTSVQLKVP